MAYIYISNSKINHKNLILQGSHNFIFIKPELEYEPRQCLDHKLS